MTSPASQPTIVTSFSIKRWRIGRSQRCLASARRASTSSQAPNGSGSTSNNTTPITRSSPARTATPSCQQRPSTSLPTTESSWDNFSDAPHVTVKITCTSFFVARPPLPAVFAPLLSILLLHHLLLILLPPLRRPPAPAPSPAPPTLTSEPSGASSPTSPPNLLGTMSSSNKASRRGNGVAPM